MYGVPDHTFPENGWSELNAAEIITSKLGSTYSWKIFLGRIKTHIILEVR